MSRFAKVKKQKGKERKRKEKERKGELLKNPGHYQSSYGVDIRKGSKRELADEKSFTKKKKKAWTR